MIRKWANNIDKQFRKEEVPQTVEKVISTTGHQVSVDRNAEKLLFTSQTSRREVGPAREAGAPVPGVAEDRPSGIFSGESLYRLTADRKWK